MQTEDGRPTHRSVGMWLQTIRKGGISLPRFQRGIEWKDSHIIDLLTALLKCRPVGVVLVLELDPTKNAPFEPHSLRDAPPISTDSCKELLLDGQQRLTALWRSLNNTFYEDPRYERAKRSFFAKITIQLNEEGDNIPALEEIRCLRQNVAADRKILDDKKEAWQQRLIPIHLLGKGHTRRIKELHEWCDEACSQQASLSRELEGYINILSSTLMSRDISFYSLPPDTPREDAINVFIKSNESSVKISRFDIAVATIESYSEAPLRDLIENIDIDPDRLKRFFGDDEDSRTSQIGELVLKISCLISDLVPTERHYTNKDVIDTVVGKWSEIVEALNWTLKFIEDERVWDRKRLPSVVPLRVIPALYRFRPIDNNPDEQARFDKRIRRYLWLSFVTIRYDHNANSRLYDDYKEFMEDRSEILDGEKYPVPTAELLADMTDPLSPPTTSNSLSRAVLIASLRGGAKDLASDKKISSENIGKRQYHHLFPKALLEGEGWKKSRINHVLNYALISHITNNKLKAQPPVEYLKKRLKIDISLDEIKQRVDSHLIPFEELNVTDGKDGKYESFLRARGKRIAAVIAELCNGRDWSP